MKNSELRRALQAAAKQADEKSTFEAGSELEAVNKGIYDLFSDTKDVYKQANGNGPHRNVSLLGTMRVKRHLRKSGQNHRQMSFATMLEWLVENWVSVVKILFSIITMFII